MLTTFRIFQYGPTLLQQQQQQPSESSDLPEATAEHDASNEELFPDAFEFIANPSESFDQPAATAQQDASNEELFQDALEIIANLL